MAEQKDKVKGTAKAEEKKTAAAKPAPKTAKAEVKPAKAAAKPAKAEVKPAKTETKPAKAEGKPAKTETKSAKAETKPAKAVSKPAAKPAKPIKSVSKADEPDMVYHISKRKEDRKWQVKAEGAAKALKLFWTQDEAIDYAKSVAGNQEGRIVIHKEDGSFRKLKY